MRSVFLPIAVFCMAMAYGGCSSARHSFNEERWHDEVNRCDSRLLYASHYKDGEFFNPWMPMKNKNIVSILEWKFSKQENSYSDDAKHYLPRIEQNTILKIRELKNENFIAWIGHNTFLIRVNGTYWLTDPIFSSKALVIKRVTPPAISLKELSTITTHVNVIITHNHYDHLDEDSIRKLPHKAKFFVPRGLQTFFRQIGKQDVVEMDWWQRVDVGNTSIICLPAQHWSKRISQPFNTTLWASYLLSTPEIKIYIGGDSGYFIGYREFGRLFPNIDYALLPTTANYPRWFMHYAHMDIREAIMAFQELRARYFIPTQWGTFPLGEEPPGYPIIELKRKIKELGLNPQQFLIMNIGGVVVVKTEDRK
ncbi:MAG: MBL fold metallo-hydrolase [Spirochaetes bacterium]|nr:MBL fold metallo-hydrolase [Spirochaetota bacterium]